MTDSAPCRNPVARSSRAWQLGLALLLAAGVCRAAEEAADATPMPDAVPLAYQYGFLPPEIYKLSPRLQNLMIRDFDADGRNDIVVVNNLRNRIDVLRQRAADEAPERIGPTEVNEVPPDARLDHRKITSSRAIAALDVADVDSDGRPDLVYLSEPSGLYVEYQDAEGNFGRERQIRVRDAKLSLWSVEVADLDGDGRSDIVFLGTQFLYLVRQGENGRLGDPERYPLGADGAGIVRVLDLDGDGRNDIVYVTDDKELPVRARLQQEGGKPGAEIRLAIDPARGVSYADIDGQPGLELLAISSRTGRLDTYTLVDPETQPDMMEARDALGRLVAYPLERSAVSARVDLAVGDFTGDGKPDVASTDSGTAQIMLFQQEQGGLDLGQAFPGMLGTLALRAGDFDGDGTAELLSLSERDNAIGLSRFDGSRLTYPRPIPTRDEPQACEVISNPDGKPVVAYIARKRGKSSRDDAYVLRLLSPQASDGKLTWTENGSKEAKPVEDANDGLALDLDAKPTDLRALDANGDGQEDLLVFLQYRAPVLLVGTADGFRQADRVSTSTLGNTLGPASLFEAEIPAGSPALLLAQSNFARKIRLDDGDRWQVLDQYNAGTGTANVTGVAACDVDGDDVPEIALYDRAASSLLLLKERDSVYRPWKERKVGALDLQGMRVADFDGDDRDDLLLFDGAQVVVLYVGGRERKLERLVSYESSVRQGQLFDVVPGDLNADEKLDLLLLEPAKHNLEIVAVKPGPELQFALRWPVFEEKSFQSGPFSGSGVEPREAVIGDVDGDGRNDIVLLVHDRVLVYRQDSPAADEPGEAGKPAAVVGEAN